ncbi:MAG: ribulose-phosphate 3-epimerase [Clostridiales bacterium]|nr:ribulose-phosphate 3-epimerase [Clostridiales bacterium]MDD7432874.1 ribulose-phosphate 3-epimerase [Clostridiales bacterium]MDY3061567.1 ribulose-phosphate 3-epimerase [Eubacteriales bacterium]
MKELAAQSFWKQKYLISTSLITLDLCNLERDVNIVEQSGLDMLHVDILDGYFSPSQPIGMDTLRAVRKLSNLPFDVHIMAQKNDFFVHECFDIGVQQLIFHLETEDHPDFRLKEIKKRGIRCGVALKPGTSLSYLDYVLDDCDTVLLMLINPGFASLQGETQVAYARRKIEDLRERIAQRNLHTKIEIDGRISRQNMQNWGQELVDIFVAGSTSLDKSRLAESSRDLAKRVQLARKGQSEAFTA